MGYKALEAASVLKKYGKEAFRSTELGMGPIELLESVDDGHRPRIAKPQPQSGGSLGGWRCIS